MQEWDPEQVPGHADGQAQARVHAGAAAVRPADGHHGVPVAAPPDEVDDLDVEHDAGDHLASEDVARNLPVEALEPALRVLDRAHHPDGSQQVEGLAQGAPPGRLGLAHVGLPSGWIRLPYAASASRSGITSSASSSGGVAMSASANTTRSPRAASIPARTAAPLPPCGTARSSISPEAISARARTRSAVPSVLPSSTTSTWISAGSACAPGRPSRPWSPRRCR